MYQYAISQAFTTQNGVLEFSFFLLGRKKGWETLGPLERLLTDFIYGTETDWRHKQILQAYL
jgi:hypothetical protein